jgi:hypothetical protein
MNIAKLFLAFTVLSLCACESKLINYNKRPALQKAVSYFDEVDYLYDIRCLDINNNSLYVVGYDAGNIFQMSMDLEPLRKLGNKGKGPGDLLITPQIAFHESKLFAISSNKQSILSFDVSTGRFLDEKKLPTTLAGSEFKYRFFYNEGIFYANNLNLGYFLFKIKDGDFFDGFEDNNEVQDTMNYYMKSGAHVLKSSDGIVHISNSKPIIQEFAIGGELLRIIDLKDVPAIKERLGFINRSEVLASNQFYNIIEDAFIDVLNEKLYILSISGRDSPLCNVISVFNLEEEIVYEGQLILASNWYKTIAVKDNSLFAFNVNNSTVEKYLIN